MLPKRTPKPVSTYKAIEKAERALEATKRQNREAFRKAIVAVCQEHGLTITLAPNLDPSACMRIEALTGAKQLDELPK